LASRGIDISRLRASFACHVILPYHRALDVAREASRGGSKVGTTGRWIVPAYEYGAARTGLRLEDLLDESALREKLARVLPEKNAALAALGAGGPLRLPPLAEQR